MKARFIVGPPGTGKTHKWIVKMYEKLLKEKITKEQIVLLSHTREAVRQLLMAVMKIKDEEGKTLEDNGYDEDFFEDRSAKLFTMATNNSVFPKLEFLNFVERSVNVLIYLSFYYIFSLRNFLILVLRRGE